MVADRDKGWREGTDSFDVNGLHEKADLVRGLFGTNDSTNDAVMIVSVTTMIAATATLRKTMATDLVCLLSLLFTELMLLLTCADPHRDRREAEESDLFDFLGQSSVPVIALIVVVSR